MVSSIWILRFLRVLAVLGVFILEYKYLRYYTNTGGKSRSAPYYASFISLYFLKSVSKLGSK